MKARRRHQLIFAAAIAGWVALPCTVAAQASRLVSMRDMGPREVRSEPFALDFPTTISVSAVGAAPAHPSSGEGWIGNAWILDAGTRAVVWALDRDGNGENRFEGTVELPTGTYLAYFATDPQSRSSSLVGRVLRRSGGDRAEFELSISGDGQLVRPGDVDEQQGVFATLSGADPGEPDRITFTVSRELEIDLYAQGEVSTGSFFDYGFVMNSASREVVWQLAYQSSDHAGGALRNRLDRRRLALSPGTYVASFTRDASHHTGDWTDAPPYDPEKWGITLATAVASEIDYVEVSDYVPPTWPNVIVDLTRIGDRVTGQLGFSLDDSTRVRVYAVSEGSGSGMDDAAWIIDAASRERVWTMDLARTEHAGGSSRNRVQHDSLVLGPGSYLVNFVSDGSYSYSSWNGGAPFDSDSWGIAVVGLGDFDPATARTFEPGDDPNAIVSLIQVGDNADLRRGFRLDSLQPVRVYALGEGDSDGMYDYGWIEDAAGNHVWEMTYAGTTRGGGASKNRLFNGLVTLPAGEYLARYRTDGSHSFGSWNSSQPDDPMAWGIAIHRATPAR